MLSFMYVLNFFIDLCKCVVSTYDPNTLKYETSLWAQG